MTTPTPPVAEEKTQKSREEISVLKITMPENATPEEIEKYKKDWLEIIKTFEKLTGEEGTTRFLSEEEISQLKNHET